MNYKTHTPREFPKKREGKGLNLFSVIVMAIDEHNEPITLCYSFDDGEWQTENCDPFDTSIDFTWYYVPTEMIYQAN